MAEKDHFAERPAGFWIRAGAHAIDSSLLMVALSPLLVIYGILLGAKVIRQNPYFDIAFAIGLVALVIGYYVIMVWKKGGTLGKLALGLQIISAQEQRPGLGRSLGRYFAHLLSGLLLCIGYIMAGLRADKKGLHDLICGTQVRRVKAIPIIGIIALCVLPMSLTGLMGISAAVAIPKFAQMSMQARESAAKAQALNLRNAIAMYQMDNNAWPKTLDALVDKYISELPKVRLKNHSSDSVEYYSFSSKGMMDPGKLKFTGGWAYDPASGNVALDVDGKDSKGKEYWMYGYE